MRQVAVFLGFLCATAASAQSFQGVVTYQMGKENESWQYSTNGSKARIDVLNSRMPGGMAMIWDANAQTMTMLLAAQKMYMAIPANQMKASADSGHGTFKKVGSEVIAGVPCDDYVGSDTKGEKDATICLAHGMGNFMNFDMNNPFMRQMASHVSGLSSAMSGGGFPLKYVKGNGETTMLATKVERKSVDGSLFTVPSDYHQMSMPGAR